MACQQHRAARLHVLLGLAPAQALGQHVVDVRGKPPALWQVRSRVPQLRGALTASRVMTNIVRWHGIKCTLDTGMVLSQAASERRTYVCVSKC